MSLSTGNQLIKLRMQCWLGPIVKPKPAITVGVRLSFDANFIEKVKIHFRQLAADTIGIFRHANWTSCAAEIAAAYDINPEFIGIRLGRNR
jgi:hypothetical protein